MNAHALFGFEEQRLTTIVAVIADVIEAETVRPMHLP